MDNTLNFIEGMIDENRIALELKHKCNKLLWFDKVEQLIHCIGKYSLDKLQRLNELFWL